MEPVNGIDVVKLGKEHVERAADAITAAFVDDPMWTCILPDREARATVLRPMWRALVDFTRIYGEAYTTSDGMGAALWMPPGRARPTIWMMIRTRFVLARSMMVLPKDARGRFFPMMRFFEGRHKNLMPGPHWYLWALGVSPNAQGRGIGKSLLQPILERADREGVPCYLETQTTGNVEFYRKSGFEVMEESREPVGDIPIWFLRREPLGSRSSS